MRAVDRDLIRGGHYGKRSCEPRAKAEHMAAPTNAANVKKALANWEPSTNGPILLATALPLLYEACFLSTPDVMTYDAGRSAARLDVRWISPVGEGDHEASFPKCHRGASSAIGPSVCAGAAADNEMRVGSAHGFVQGVQRDRPHAAKPRRVY